MEYKEEIFKEIPDANGYYISNLGNVKIDPGVNLHYPNGIVKTEFNKDKDGYYRMSIKVNGISKGFVIHRLVAMAFIPNTDVSKTCVNHKDANRTNNNVENLEWVTPRENVLHSFQYGNRHKCLEVPRVCKLTDYQISQIDVLRQYYSLKKIADLFNISYTSIKNIVIKRNRNKKLDNQQPSLYSDIIKEGSTTIPKRSTPKQEETPCLFGNEE